MKFSQFFTGCLGVALMSLPALAQELTPDQINALFNRQIEAQNQPLTRSLTGMEGRGLSLITVEDVAAEPVQSTGLDVTLNEQTLVAPTTDDSATTTLTSDGTDATLATTTPQPLQQIADPNMPLVYAKLDPELQVNLQIKFEFDSAALTNPEKRKLSTMCAAIQASDIAKFRIIGHTDTSGSDAYNERLSVLRAKEVARHLVQECGIAADRLETVGMGERFPVNTNDPKAEENRRVEFQALV